jgi:hypothetical protein
VVHRLTATADDKGAPGRDPEYGYGIVNLVNALTADVPPLAPSPAPATTTGDVTPPTDGGGFSRTTLAVFAALTLAAMIGVVAVGVALVRRARE